jgi:hypothetical protein
VAGNRAGSASASIVFSCDRHFDSARKLDAQVAVCPPDIEAMFGLSIDRLSSWRGAPPGFATSSRLRGEVKPPSLRCEPPSGWQRVKFWMLAPSPAESSPPLSQLPDVRAAFLACLDDAAGDEACALSLRIERASSLRELWHLRASVFGCLARQFSQSEAQLRLGRLSPHFEARGLRQPWWTPA